MDDMKTMRQQSPDALQKAIGDAQARLRELGFQLASHQVKNVREVRVLRTKIAQLRTALAEKQTAAKNTT